MNCNETVINSITRIINANLIGEEILRKLLINIFQVLAKNSDVNTENFPNCSKPDILKELEGNLFIITSQFVRHSTSRTEVANFLKKSKIAKNFIESYSELYEKYYDEIEQTLINLGHHNDQLIDVNYLINYVITSSGSEESGGPLFRVGFKTREESGLQKFLNFTCTIEEMQDMVEKFKDILQHTHRLSKN